MTDIKKKLQDEITSLEYELHVELPKEILKARAHGDLSENAEYHAAKDRQGFVNARLNQLKKRLGEMAMIDFSKIASTWTDNNPGCRALRLGAPLAVDGSVSAARGVRGRAGRAE